MRVSPLLGTYKHAVFAYCEGRSRSCTPNALNRIHRTKRRHAKLPMFLTTESSTPSYPPCTGQLKSANPLRLCAFRPTSVRTALCLVWILQFCLAPPLVSAQQAPLVTPRDLRPETPTKPPAALPQPAPAVVPPNAENLFVRIGEVSVKDGFPEFTTATEALLSQVRSQRISVASLYKLAQSIEMFYHEAGYALVRVVVPPQKLNDGDTLRLIVLDGFIERIDASAVDAHSRNRVMKVMQPLVGQQRLRGEALERALTLAGRAPGLALRSTLLAGSEPGGVILTLDGSFTRVNGSFSGDDRLPDALGPGRPHCK